MPGPVTRPSASAIALDDDHPTVQHMNAEPVTIARLSILLAVSTSTLEKLAADRAWLWGGLPIPERETGPRVWSSAGVIAWLRALEERGTGTPQ